IPGGTRLYVGWGGFIHQIGVGRVYSPNRGGAGLSKSGLCIGIPGGTRPYVGWGGVIHRILVGRV
ncbi:MAG: hypothetical protein ABWU14_17025, partial [Limnospira maxima]